MRAIRDGIIFVLTILDLHCTCGLPASPSLGPVRFVSAIILYPLRVSIEEEDSVIHIAFPLRCLSIWGQQPSGQAL
ncbi:hypothetical protein BD310DRAFT_949584 [Dichomitus squalens]|uniref:Secreted protein n=1 Tax=Dichomitus squalens TaxID=114155 RepID=A0A4Q9PS23_9APHY|nr:hypothetical protein BD310DRAFT_949584 [Dichomitus squalens]